ncbi:MAG: hypothetical protein IT308_12080 [Anaerolineaceae bacterium]|nr:hypothetical protein [Anaerolineaceae bacterium]
MVKINKLDTESKAEIKEFIQFHFDLYKNCPQWVPPFRQDIALMLNRKKHPFYDHSDADFFVARRDGKIVGRVAAMENKPFNQYHNTHKLQFYLFDSIDDQEITDALFGEVTNWGRGRGLTEIIGPKGFSAFDGYGIQVEGFEHRQMMTMMNYNFPYYEKLMEKAGFTKENDFVSCYVPRERFILPDKAEEIARRVRERGTFVVKNFKNKRELKDWAWRIGDSYNKTFINNWEYYPLSEREVQFLLDNLLVLANPKLIKIILHNEEIVGFLFGFPDVSKALQRHDGRITPWAIADILIEAKRTKWISLNGVGILPEYQGRGGNALLYSEIRRTVWDFGFDHAEQTQMADTAVQVRRDMESVGAKIYKVHRIFHKVI